MTPGDTIKLDDGEWYVEKVELRGVAPDETEWALLSRRTGKGKKKVQLGRRWIEIEREE